jgi:hypothetical protein
MSVEVCYPRVLLADTVTVAVGAAAVGAGEGFIVVVHVVVDDVVLPPAADAVHPDDTHVPPTMYE